MGCFDFVYADNGMNTRGGKGFLYLSNCFAKAARLQNPLRFSESDWYGRLSCPIGKDKTLVELDIYAIYGAMLNMADDASAPLGEHSTAAARYAELIRERNFDSEELEKLEDNLRFDGIDYFFYMQTAYSAEEKVTVKALSGQNAKRVVPQCMFVGTMPLLLSRKKLPAGKGDDLSDIAQNWGFVTDSDPKQGCGITRNHYMVYRPGAEKRQGNG